MQSRKYMAVVLMLVVIVWGLCSTLSAQQQGTKDTSFFNNKGAGIPNSGNTLYPNNGPEFPHSSPGNPTTDPGPLTPGTNGNMLDTVPHFRIK